MIVLNFHGLGEPHDEVPEDERPFWFGYSEFEDLLGRIWSDFDPARFAFTFDDGNHSDLFAAEELARKGAIGRFFALAGRLDHPHYLSAGDLRDLRAQGMVVGLHGRDHVDWRACDSAALQSEIGDARRELEAVLDEPIDEAAIPYGRYNKTVMNALKQSGFRRIHTSDGGPAKADDIVWNRNTLRCDMPQSELSDILHGRWSGLNAARRKLVGLAKRNFI